MSWGDRRWPIMVASAASMPLDGGTEPRVTHPTATRRLDLPL
jgi:hypothetical protein